MSLWGDVSPRGRERLETYSSLLSSLGTKLGLAHLSPDGANEQICRSLLLAGLLRQFPKRAKAPPILIDVGSGSGLPAIPLAIGLSDDLSQAAPRVVMVEPKRRAVAFLEKVVRELDLEATVVAQSAEQAAAAGWGSKADFVSAKALASPTRALELCSPLCKIGGIIVLTGKKGVKGLHEAVSPDDLRRLGLRGEGTQTLRRSDVSQTVHLLRKDSPGHNSDLKAQG